MPINFHCPACGTPIEVDDEHAGWECDCPNCSATVAIPQSDEQPTATDKPAGTPPPQPPPPRMSPPIQSAYSAPPPDEGRKGLAIGALVCGIVAFCLPPLALVAIVLGIVALFKISSKPKEYGGQGLAIAGICTGGVALLLMFVYALLISILLPSLARARELSKRTVCAANLKGLGTGFYTYANENSDMWPIPAHALGDSDTVGMVDYTAAIGSFRGQAGNPAAGDVSAMDPFPSKLSTTRGLWTLVRTRMASQNTFICPSSNDTPNTDANPEDYWDFGQGDITGPATAAQARQGWQQVSYGYQVPFGRYGQPSCDRHQNMALAADKGPYGAAFDAGFPAPPAITVTQQMSPSDWRAWNSPNHGGPGDGEGQNVLYADGHVAWHNESRAGVKDDNIYTQWSGNGTTFQERARGNPPTQGGRQTPAGHTDTLIYP